MMVAFSIRLDRIDESLLYEARAAGERGPAIGYWREIGNKPRPPESKPAGFDLAKYKRAPQGAGQSQGNQGDGLAPGDEGLGL